MSAGELLYAVSKSLASITSESLGLPYKNTTKRVRQTLGEYYREYSSSSVHELDISEQTVYQQLKSLVLTEASIVKALGNNLEKFLKNASSEFIKNVRAEATKRNYIIKNDTVFVDTSKDKFRRIRELVNSGFNTTNAYNISKFMQSEAQKLGITDLAVPTSASQKFGFDVGHVESNIISAYGALILNSIRRSKIQEKILYSEDLLKTLNKLLDDVKDPNKAAELMSLAGISDKKLFEACIDATIGFTKRIVSNDLNVVLKVEPKLDRTTIRKIAEQVTNKVIPENARLQQQFGASFEKSIANHLSTNSKGYFLNMLVELTRPGSKLNILDIKGSPSAKELALDLITSEVTRSPKKLKSGKTTAKHKSNNKTLVVNVKSPKSSTRTINKETVPKLRNLRGQFTSTTKLETLIRTMLLKTIQKNMQRPNLRNQTGRLAQSIKLDNLQLDREGTLTAFLSYMKYPYATFERGGRQGFRGYYPSRLIDQSVREIAKTLTINRLKTVIV